MRKNWLTTTAGIMASMITVPVGVAGLVSAGMQVPHWWASVQFVFVIVGAVGTALLGFSAKGQDEHSTADQVQMSTIEKHVDQQMQAQQQSKSAGA